MRALGWGLPKARPAALQASSDVRSDALPPKLGRALSFQTRTCCVHRENVSVRAKPRRSPKHNDINANVFGWWAGQVSKNLADSGPKAPVRAPRRH